MWSLRVGIVALELQRARPVNLTVERGTGRARRLRPADGALAGDACAGIVAEEERESCAPARDARACGRVVDFLHELLEFGDVGRVLDPPPGVAVDPPSHGQQVEARCDIVGRCDVQGAAYIVERYLVNEATGGILAGLAEVVDCVGGVAGALIVLGDQAVELADAIAAADDEPVGNLAVQITPQPLQHTLVGDLMQHMMPEGELARALERARLAPIDKLAPSQGLERVAGVQRDPAQRLVPEHVTDNARVLQRVLLMGRQAVDARLQDTDKGRRHAHIEKLVGRDAPRLAVGDDDSIVDQHADQLLDEVRVALGAARQQVAQRRRDSVEAAEQCLDQLVRSSLRERRKVNPEVLAACGRPERSPLVKRRPRHAEQENWQVGAGLREMVDESERAFIGPVEVI